MDQLKRISQYCEKHSSFSNGVLQELERETHLKTLAPQMMSGPLQGQLLSMMSRWIKPSSILEIGTFTGYGTICLTSGLAPNGRIHTIEVNPELTHISSKYFKKAGILQKVIHHIGQAETIIPTLSEQFELVFIDAGKQDYQNHYDLVIDKMAVGGVLLADNVLWSGKVGTGLKDKDTNALEMFNQQVFEDQRVENLLLPIRDGLMIVIKK